MSIVEFNVSEEAFRRMQRLARARRQKLSDLLSDFLPSLLEESPRARISGDDRTLRVKASSACDPEDVSRVFEAFGSGLPRKVRRSAGGPDVPVEFVRTERGDLAVTLESGRMLVDPGEPARLYRDLFPYVRDRLPSYYSLEHYHLACQAEQRYLKYLHEPAKFHLPDSASVMVDAGAYVGFKAMAMADHMGPQGLVIAIEMMGDNYETLVYNIELNGLSDRIVPIHVAVSDGTPTARHYRRSEDRKTNSIVAIDGAGPGELGEVRAESLESILARVGVGHVDYLNVQLNGAESSALAGLGSYLERTGTVFAACPHKVRGEPLRQPIVDLLEGGGFEIVEEGKPGRVVAQRTVGAAF